MMTPSLRDLFNKYGSDKSRTHAYDVAYQIYCDTFREKATSILEIGVDRGGSIRAWKDYFPSARIVGIDRSEACRQHMPDGTVFECGSQADGEFLRSVAERHGPFDMVVDDGNHRPFYQMTALRALWTSLKAGGLYAIEDISFGTIDPQGRCNREHSITPFDAMVDWAKRGLGRFDATPGLAITFYRNGIFIFKPYGSVGGWL